MSEKIKDFLESLYREYIKEKYNINDPIIFPSRFDRPQDIEVVALIASSFAYGSVNLFIKKIDEVLNNLGKSPYEYILNFDIEKSNKNMFDNFRYRFNNGDDVLALIYGLSKTLRKWGRLKNLFLNYFEKTKDLKSSLIEFTNEIKRYINDEPYFSNKKLNVNRLIASPEKKSACKRLNLFLRWMVRDQDIDFGIWKEIGKENLIIPLDTHVGRISRCLGLLKRKSNDWNSAVELTNSLKKFDPHDPLKYDFALCHIGIERVCNQQNCDGCIIKTKVS